MHSIERRERRPENASLDRLWDNVHAFYGIGQVHTVHMYER
jgi:hypothetical protein